MSGAARDLADSLARHAEPVCRHYLSNGRRYGGYWIVGDIRNAPGRSTYVRLKPKVFGATDVGRWNDTATGEYGDLLDVIRESCGFERFHEVADEARRFLALPRPQHSLEDRDRASASSMQGSWSAKRFLSHCRPIEGTLAETYLRRRGVTHFEGTRSLRFHPSCFYRPEGSSITQRWPALIGVVTDLASRVTGVHRTWLHPDLICPDHGKAPIESPKRSLGNIWTHAVRFGEVDDVMAAGEGLETLLSLRTAFPNLPAIAALSASHLGAVAFPPTLRRLYVAADADPAGQRAGAALVERARAVGIEAIDLAPERNDFNNDLRALGVEGLRASLISRISAEDRSRFLSA